jgi:hypothetical protein
MAKPLGPKSLLIREAIKNNPDLGNTEIAQLLNGSEDRKKDKIEVKPDDVAQQKQAMKKLGWTGAAIPTPAPASKPAGNGRRKGRKRPKAASQPSAPVSKTNQAGVNTVEAAKQVKELVDRYGAETVKGLAELFGGK